MRDEERGYRPIRDYAVIGDMRTAALVAGDGSIDWCCLPHFDSPAVFCRLLDAAEGGWFRVGPAGKYDVSRSYVRATNVLASTYTSDSGRLRVTDLMPVGRRPGDRGAGEVESGRRILRLVEGLAGEVEVEVGFRPTFDYAQASAKIIARAGGAVARTPRESLVLDCPVRLACGDAGSAGAPASPQATGSGSS